MRSAIPFPALMLSAQEQGFCGARWAACRFYQVLPLLNVTVERPQLLPRESGNVLSSGYCSGQDTDVTLLITSNHQYEGKEKQSNHWGELNSFVIYAQRHPLRTHFCSMVVQNTCVQSVQIGTAGKPVVRLDLIAIRFLCKDLHVVKNPNH